MNKSLYAKVSVALSKLSVIQNLIDTFTKIDLTRKVKCGLTLGKQSVLFPILMGYGRKIK